jgi:hypothetical protein
MPLLQALLLSWITGGVHGSVLYPLDRNGFILEKSVVDTGEKGNKGTENQEFLEGLKWEEP